MNARGVTIVAALALTGAALAQTYPFSGPGRVFTWLPASNPYNFLFDSPFPAGAAGNFGSVLQSTFINVDPYVFVGGNFDETINVSGMGNGTSSTASDDYQVLTNMDLTFYLANFVAVAFIPNSGTAFPGPHAVTVNYEFDAYSNYSSGQNIDPTGTASGNLLSTATLSVDDSTPTPQSATVALPLSSTTDGVGALRVKRTVLISGQAPGDASYNSQGDLVVTIN